MLPHTQILDTLLCNEDHFDTTENTPLQHQHSLNFNSFTTPFEQDDELRSLLHKEQQNEPHRRSQTKPQIEEVIQWMLRAIAYYSFSPLTAVLAVTYLDKFLHRFDSDKPWMFQLAAVASLSLAAKVEETDVPLLLDFQPDSDTSEYSGSPAKRRRRRGGGGEGTSGGGAATLQEVGSAISRSASIIAEAIQSCEDREEERHKEMVSLHKRRLQIEESKAEINRQGINGLVDAINKLANSMLALAANRSQPSSK